MVLVGFADSSERSSSNLGILRAKEAKKYLVSKGIDPSRILTRAGVARSNVKPSENMRVETVIVPKGAVF